MANRLEYARSFDPYAKGNSLDELLRVRRQLAKVMNQRMVRLENTTSNVTGEAYTFGAYDLMQDYLKKQGRPTKDGRARFSEIEIPMTQIKEMAKEGKSVEEIEQALIRQTQKEIRVLQGFEDLKSSQISGMKDIERQRKATFMSATDTRAALHEEVVSNKDFYDFLNSATYKEIVESFDSETLIEEYDKAASRGATPEQIIGALDKYVSEQRMGEELSIKGLQEALGAIEIDEPSPWR